MSSMFSRNDAQKYSYQDPRQKKVTRNIALLISTTTVPVSIVSAPYFKKLIQDLNPHAKVPERKMMRGEISKVWEDLRDALKNALNVARKISLTTDIWTSKNMVASYLGITVHFFNSKTRCRAAHKIACREFPNPHTGENKAHKIISICKEFGIEHKLDYISCDNGSNMVASFRFYEEEDGEEEGDAFDAIEEASDEETIDLEEPDENDNINSMEPLETGIETDILPDIENTGAVGQQVGDQAVLDNQEVKEEINEHVARDEQIDAVFGESKIKRGRCYAHKGQLAINKANNMRSQVFGRVIAKAKRYVNKYRASAKAKYILK